MRDACELFLAKPVPIRQSSTKTGSYATGNLIHRNQSLRPFNENTMSYL
jgi:hypothetical protein